MCFTVLKYPPTLWSPWWLFFFSHLWKPFILTEQGPLLCFCFFFFSCSLLDLLFWWILHLFFVPFFHKHPYTNRNCFGIVYMTITHCQILLFWDVCSGDYHLSSPHFFTIYVSIRPRYFPDFTSYFVLTPFFFKYLTSLIPLS